MQRRQHLRISRFLLPGYTGTGRSPPPLKISDGMILQQVDTSSWFSDSQHSPSWIGWPLARISRRNVSDAEHRRQIEVALASAIERGIVCTIARRGSKLRYFARPVVPEPGCEIVSDELVPPPKPMRKLAPAPKPSKPDVVPEPPVEVVADTVAVPARIVRELSRVAPNALTLLMLLKLDYGQERGSFNLIVFELARRYNMAPQRINTALLSLVAKGLIIDQHREYTGIDGRYGWLPARARWASKPGAAARRRKRAAEASHVGAI
jgi:hypothetical protein